jgi:hypothetical protein
MLLLVPFTGGYSVSVPETVKGEALAVPKVTVNVFIPAFPRVKV